MVRIGNYNTLKIIKFRDQGAYLDGGEFGEILLPHKYVPENAKINSLTDVFIYKDSDDRLIATTEKPKATVGEFAYLKVVNVSTFGAFLDWGLAKDLLVPFSEQKTKFVEGKYYVVAVFLDTVTNRIAASAKIEKFLKKTLTGISENQEVDIIIYKETPLGYKAVINNSYSGLLYKNEIFQPLAVGSKCKAFVSKFREDNKIDLSLSKSGFEKIDLLTEKILILLRENNGYLALSDSSDAEEIYKLFHESKKSFKKAIGKLYKDQLIMIGENSIKLIKK